jgi:hypothetical protein
MTRIPRYILLFTLIPGATTLRAEVTRLGPIPQPAHAPAVCQIIGVLPDSPAQKAGLHVGDRIESVNGVKPKDATAVADLIGQSGPEADLAVKRTSGGVHHLKVTLNKERPRMGAVCDLTGWRKDSVSGAGNEAVTVFDGPYAVTFSGIIDKGLAFIRVRFSNHSDHLLTITRALFTVADANKNPLVVLSPAEVIYFLHGDGALSLLKPPAAAGAEPESMTVSETSIVRQAAPTHKGKKNWTRTDESYVKANAEYLNKESLWPTTVPPGGTIDGLIYFLEPKALPFTLVAHIDNHNYSASFGKPQPSRGRMSAEQLINFFEAQKKGTPIKLTLKNGKVFVGKYSSYDSINEIVWFDTPSGVLLTTSSFGLKYIQSAEIISPDADKKPASEPLN